MSNGLVHGVGIYEKGRHQAKLNGKITKPYDAWKNMLKRCYDTRCQEKHPTYAGCVVCDAWLRFQAFAEWFEINYPKDGNKYYLDKDLKVLGNKSYSPETCLFVSRQVNNFTTDSGAVRGAFMIGVSWHRQAEKLRATCGNPITGKQESLGCFTSELQAHLVWRKRKSQLAYELAMIQDNPEVTDALLQWKLALDNNIIHPY